VFATYVSSTTNQMQMDQLVSVSLSSPRVPVADVALSKGTLNVSKDTFRLRMENVRSATTPVSLASDRVAKIA
jgi:hypothetical protein